LGNTFPKDFYYPSSYFTEKELNMILNDGNDIPPLEWFSEGKSEELYCMNGYVVYEYWKF
jgi:hypothetical protein